MKLEIVLMVEVKTPERILIDGIVRIRGVGSPKNVIIRKLVPNLSVNQNPHLTLPEQQQSVISFQLNCSTFHAQLEAVCSPTSCAHVMLTPTVAFLHC